MLNKFIKQNTKLTSIVDDSIITEIKRRNFRFDHEVYYTKHLTQCPRRIMYRANATPIEIELNFLEENQRTYGKKKWIDFFAQSGRAEVLDRDIVAADCNYNIVGTVDAVIRFNDIVSIFSVESLNHNEYVQAQETQDLKRQIIVDIMMLMWLTEVGNGILLLEDLTTQEYFLSHVIPYKPIIDSAREKCLKLLEQKINNQLPDRAYSNITNKECNKCEYSKACWEKEKVDG